MGRPSPYSLEGSTNALMVKLELTLPVFLCYLIATAQIAFAAQVNRSIDDTYGDSVTGDRPTYLPTTGGVWADATCQGCAIQPNPSLAFDGSWTASTYHPALNEISFQFQFTGIAIYVFFIIPNTAAPGVTTQTECNFTLDGQLSGSFSHIPTASLDYIYNALVFSTTNLPNANHVLNVSTSGLDYSVFVNFDYAIYTFDDQLPSSPPPSSSPNPNPSPNSNSNPSANAASTTNLQSASQITASNSHPLSTAGTTLTGNPLAAVNASASGTTGGGIAVSQSTAGASSSSSSTTHHGSGLGTNLLAGVVGSSVGAVAILLIVFSLLCRKRRLKTEAAGSLSSTTHGYTVTSADSSRPTDKSSPSLVGITSRARRSLCADARDLDHMSGAALGGTPRRFSTLVRLSQPEQKDINVATPLQILASEYSRQLHQHTGLGEPEIGRLELASAHRTGRRQLEEQQSESSWGQFLASDAPPEYSPDPIVHG